MSKRPLSRVRLRIDDVETVHALYRAFVDASPVVGTAQMFSELQRLVDGGRAAGGLQGHAATRTK